VKIRVLAIGSQPIDMVIYMVIRSVGSSTTVLTQKWLSTVAAHDSSIDVV